MRMIERSLKRLTFLALLCLTCSGCAHYPINQPLSEVSPDSGYRYGNVRLPPVKERPFVVLAFSGGGTRAAAFSFGLMEQLKEVRYIAPDGTKRRLLDDVEVISSVSGGSFTSAYYALFPERFFDQFPKQVLSRNIQGALIGRLLNPYNWLRLPSSDFSRIDMADEYYNKEIFEEATFADLTKRPKGSSPFLILNATDIGINHRFEFTQDQFDLLCSDLSGVTVSRGVAASSDFPVAFAPLTLNAYKSDCGPLPLWVENAMDPRNRDKRRISEGRAAHSYREPDRIYAHLLDGGLSDNLGLRSPFQAATTTDSSWSLVNLINKGDIGRIVFISANAKTAKKRSWDKQSIPPGATDVLGVVMNGPMDDVSSDSLESTDGFFKQMKQMGQTIDSCNERLKETGQGAATGQPAAAVCPRPAPIPNPITADFSFTELSFDDVADPRLRRCLQELPTNFSLPEPTVNLLRQAARLLLTKSASFNEVMTRIDPTWKPGEVEIDRKLVDEVCGGK